MFCVIMMIVIVVKVSRYIQSVIQIVGGVLANLLLFSKQFDF
jgi:hypothetical protein